MIDFQEIEASYSPAGSLGQRCIEIFGHAVNGVRRLNVGCGGQKFPGWINADKELPWLIAEGREQEPDVLWDMDYYHEIPLPLESFDVILASHVLEHVADPVAVVFRLHTLLKPGGRLLVLVPNAWSDVGLCNPFHRNYFSMHSFVYYRKSTYDQPGTPGYHANEGRPIADWASVQVAMVDEYEIAAVLTK